MINELINYIQGCCKQNEEGKRKRKIVFIIGIILVSFKVFFGFIYKISKWFHNTFYTRKMIWLRNLLYFIVLIAILFIGIKIYIMFNYIN